jgi:hypothetical protein
MEGSHAGLRESRGVTLIAVSRRLTPGASLEAVRAQHVPACGLLPGGCA